MFDEVPLYALAAGLFLLALAAAVFLLFLRRYYFKKRQNVAEKSLADLEKTAGIGIGAETKNFDNTFSAHPQQQQHRTFGNYGAASGAPRTLSMVS